MDTGTDRTPDSGAEGQWLTYGELASIRRIDRHSAVKLVTRHQWRRQKDNRGVLRILVPAEWATSKDRGTDEATDKGPDTGTDEGTDIAHAISALQGALTSVEKRAESAENRAKQAESRAESAENERRAAESRVETANARADRLHDAVTVLEVKLTEAEVVKEAARKRAHELANRVLVLLSAEDRVAGLRDLLAEAERRAADAEDGRKAVLAHSDALDRAEFERRGKGRWARLRAAWRGE
jgi:hypothetical protein